jgi:hypothetical protein
MADTLTQREQTPAWIEDLCREIDSLQFTIAFNRFTADAELHFGAQVFRGAQEMKALFIKIDSPIIAKHQILETWSGERMHFLRGQAEMAKRKDPDKKVTAPFMWVFYGDVEGAGSVTKWLVTAGPLKADAVL